MEIVMFKPDMQEAVFAFLQSCIPKTLFVDGGQRGRGYGRRLLGRALSFAAQSGYRRAALDTRAQDTAAIALYKSVGFYETAPYHDNPHADIFMELILEQTRLMK